jgi:small-conductance mechanosensitive channel
MLEKLSIDGSVMGPWLVVAFVQILWCLAGWAIQRFVTSHLRKWAEKTEGTFDDAIVAALPAPLNILVLVTGLMVAVRFAPLTDEKIVRFNGVIEILLMLAFVYFADRLIQAVLDSFEKKHVALKPLHFIISALLHVLVWGLGVMTVLSNLGVSITPLLASLGVGSLAVALALQSTLANLFSGFYLLLDRPVRVGDLIKLESGEEGTVEVVGWRTAQIKTLGNVLIVLPNSKLAEAKILNYDRPDKEMGFFVEVGVAYQSDLDQVERVTVETAKEVLSKIPGAAKNFEPVVRYTSFGPSSIDFNVNLRAQGFTDQFLIKHEFIKALKKRYEKEGIEIPYPTQTVMMVPPPAGSTKGNT